MNAAIRAHGFSLIEMLVLALLISLGVATVVAPISLNASRKAQATGFVDAVFALQENLRTAHASREGYEGLTLTTAIERGWMPTALRATNTAAVTPWGAPITLVPGSIMDPPGATSDAFVVSTSIYNARICADVLVALAPHAGYIQAGTTLFRDGRLAGSPNRATHADILMATGMICKGVSKANPLGVTYANV